MGIFKRHYDNQKQALEQAGIKLSEKSGEKVDRLFENLEKIQVQICIITSKEISN